MEEKLSIEEQVKRIQKVFEKYPDIEIKEIKKEEENAQEAED